MTCAAATRRKKRQAPSFALTDSQLVCGAGIPSRGGVAVSMFLNLVQLGSAGQDTLSSLGPSRCDGVISLEFFLFVGLAFGWFPGGGCSGQVVEGGGEVGVSLKIARYIQLQPTYTFHECSFRLFTYTMHSSPLSCSERCYSHKTGRWMGRRK